MDKINILIADDHPLILDGLKNIITELDYVNDIYTATNGKMALDIINIQNISILITDISMPEISGVELAKIVKNKFKKIKIIIISQFEDIQIIKPLIKIDVDGIIVKSQDKESIKQAITKVFEGEKYYSPTINNLIIKVLQNTHEDNIGIVIKLSKRENEILQLISDEKTNKEIAEILFISVPTVETYRRILFSKFEVKNSVGLIKKAINIGFIS